MILTKKKLQEIQDNMRIKMSAGLVEELLDQYGHPVSNDEGHVFEYTEQDIYEQVRKIIQERNDIHSIYVYNERSR